MAFYAHPTQLISPGDIYPEIPFVISVPPLKVARKSKFNPPQKFGPQDLRRIFNLPEDISLLQDLSLSSVKGEESLVHTRLCKAIVLSWGSQVEADERDISNSGRSQRKGWLAAPIFSLEDVPINAVIRDSQTGEEVNMRDIVRKNLSHNYFYLPSFPANIDAREYYVDFRKITCIGIDFFVQEKSNRLATLSLDALNGLYSRLMWFITRAEYFFQPISCKDCGKNVEIDVRFHGQNFDAEPWEWTARQNLYQG